MKFKRKLEAAGRNDDRTNPLIWLAAVICTIIAIAVTVSGIIIFIAYLVIHPRVPTISITNAHLDLLKNDYAGLLQTQITIVMRAQNGNAKAHATFSHIRFNMSSLGQDIAVLVADSFEVPKNEFKDLNYVVQSSSIPLNPDQFEKVGDAWKKNEIVFNLIGSAKTMSRVGKIGSFKLLVHLACDLKFHPLNGTYIPSRCTSNSK
ncbi:PREDICTED: uncharacterized protein LOC109350896 [Lupinus angustifolius]|uniref:uncharacterized protein LOC109350896 n=1 Tax=Lupinus angustifolius TaxID=3871 RepID=UPI00092EFA0B|nr:PREDICTED: uncharacterized protein LOC109350896 [Lupinus angustifolius]